MQYDPSVPAYISAIPPSSKARRLSPAGSAKAAGLTSR